MGLYYSDDHVQLFHGDCLTEHLEWLEADVLVTDPPYGRAWRQGLIGTTKNQASESGIANDQNTGVRDAALTRWGIGKPSISFGDLMLTPPENTKLVGVYAKPNDSGLRGAMGGVRRDAEAIYFIGKWQSGIGGRSSVFKTTAPQVGGAHGLVARNGGHPHVKPLDVLEHLIIQCPPGVIADPFAGSGSTLVAAKVLGRRAIGVELEERYCEIAARRLSQEVIDLGNVS